jgi:hypothetical protein
MHSAPTQLLDALAQCLIQTVVHLQRTRAAIKQALGRRCQPHDSDAVNEQFASFKRGSGILMAVPPVVLLMGLKR